MQHIDQHSRTSESCESVILKFSLVTNPSAGHQLERLATRPDELQDEAAFGRSLVAIGCHRSKNGSLHQKKGRSLVAIGCHRLPDVAGLP